MSATAQQIIERALRRIAVLAAEEAQTNAELVDNLQVMNDMMAGFGPLGIYYVHTTLAAGDTVNVPDEQVRNVMLLLCWELADNYDMPITPALNSSIANAKNALQAYYHVSRPGLTDPLLRQHQWGRFDITRGS